MPREMIHRVRCDKCHTIVELDEHFSPLPKGWETLDMNREDNDEPYTITLCPQDMRRFRVFMGFMSMQDAEVQEIKEEDPKELFGFGSMA